MRLSPADLLNPTYCPGCKTQIPNAMSAAQRYCSTCLDKLQPPTIVQTPSPSVVPMRSAAPAPIATAKLGICQACGSRNIVQKNGAWSGTNIIGQIPVLGCGGFAVLLVIASLLQNAPGALMLGLFFLLLVALASLALRSMAGNRRTCQDCGHTWKI